MKGDFTRDTFDPKKHYLRVLMQQGRVQLDADWNEQVAILLHRLERLANDLFGPYGGPEQYCGFEILCRPGDRDDFSIGPGRYYVDGVLCENDTEIRYSSQSPEPGKGQDFKQKQPYLVYLDAWEDYVSAAQDASIREVALGGSDTAGRSKVICHVRTRELKTVTMGTDITKGPDIDPSWDSIMKQLQPENRGWLKVMVRVKDPAAMADLTPCITPPSARYRGAENQLYRVEIHNGGPAADPTGKTKEAATFKWSRENGSVVYPVTEVDKGVITLEHLGRDARLSLQIGDWVEAVDNLYTSQNRVEALFKVTKVDPMKLQVTVEVKGQAPFGGTFEAATYPYLRRWDQKESKGGLQLRDGAAILKEGEGERNWLALEDGIEIQFQPKGPDQKGPQQYRTGDYWLIAARTASGGNVDWPQDKDGKPESLRPHGVEHHCAPLSAISLDGNQLKVQVDYRLKGQLPLHGGG